MATSAQLPVSSASQTPLYDLIGQISLGDLDAFARLYDRTAAQVYGLVLQILKDRAHAEEVTIDVYMRVWQRAALYDSARSTPITWLIMLARSRAIDSLRSRKIDNLTKQLNSADFVVDGSPSPEEKFASDGERDGMRSALNALCSDQREAIEMAFYSGFSHSEIAAKIRQPTGTIKSRIRLGMQNLRKHLQRDGEGVRRMVTLPFDIFKFDGSGELRWIEAASGLENAKERVRAQAGEYLILNQRTGEKLRIKANNLSDQETLNRILDEAIEMSHADFGNIQLFTRTNKTLHIAVHRGFSQRFLDFFGSVNVDESCACGTVLRERRRVIVNDVADRVVFSDSRTLETMLSDNIRAVQSMPLFADSQFVGVLSVHYREPGISPEWQSALTEEFLKGAATAISGAV